MVVFEIFAYQLPFATVKDAEAALKIRNGEVSIQTLFGRYTGSFISFFLFPSARFPLSQNHVSTT